MIVKYDDLPLITIPHPNSHLQIPQENPKLLLLSRSTKKINRMLKAVANTSVHSSTVVLVIALMFISLSLQTPTL
jgi:hypothetical protein